jgi:glycosyltransferase A (GT-A) superfamily protein (DUF2064 family)
VAQRGADLSQRMGWAVREAAAAGARRILLRGSDSPVLDAKNVGAALAALERADLVLCPDRDGGYSLIGLRAAHDALFDLELSTGGVLADTLRAARRLGLRHALLAPHYDVDTARDLEQLAHDVDSGLTPRTRAWLEEAKASLA